MAISGGQPIPLIAQEHAVESLQAGYRLVRVHCHRATFTRSTEKAQPRHRSFPSATMHTLLNLLCLLRSCQMPAKGGENHRRSHPSSSNRPLPTPSFEIHLPLREASSTPDSSPAQSTTMMQAFTRSWKTSRPQRTFRTQTKDGYVSQIFKRQVYEVVSTTELPKKSPNHLADQTGPTPLLPWTALPRPTKTIRRIIQKAGPSNAMEEEWAHDYLVATLPSRIKLQQIRVKVKQTQSKTQAQGKKEVKRPSGFGLFSPQRQPPERRSE